MLWLRLAIKELLRNRRFSLFFILNLSIGLVGFIALNSFNNSIETHLKNNLKEILTADLMINSPRPLNAAEDSAIESVLGPDKKESRQISFFSMISDSQASKLAHVIAIDGAFPLYGSIMSENGTSVPLNSKDLSSSSLHGIKSSPGQETQASQKNDVLSGKQTDSNYSTRLNIDSSLAINRGISKAWLTQDLAVALETSKGGVVKIGDKDFIVDDIVTATPEASVTSIELAPKIYIGLYDAEKTGLVKFGSRINFTRYYRFPSGFDIKARTIALREKIDVLFDGNPTISVYNSDDVNQNLNRVFGYFTGYMGLISIVALFLAGIGTAYLFRGYLNTRLKEIAILMSLGARRIDSYLMFMFQVSILGAISTFLSVILSLLLLPLFPRVLQGLIPQNFHAATDINSVTMAFILGIFGSIIFCLPVFVRVHALKPVILLQGVHVITSHVLTVSRINSRETTSEISTGDELTMLPEIFNIFMHFIASWCGRLSKKTTIHYLIVISSLLPVTITFWLLSVGQTRSFERGSVFFAGSLCVMAVMTTVGWLLLNIVKKLSFTNRFIRKIAFRNLYRNQISTISCFVTIAMGAFLINVIPQIRNGIQDEISRPEGMKIPGFFLIDIQPEQLRDLTQFLEARNYSLTNVSPIIRGRIIKVNDKGFYDRFDEKTDEAPSRKGRYRRREFNFSYRSSLDDSSEKIVKGRALSKTPWNFESSEPMEISLEEGFAERFHLKIGDVMSFDVQGISLQGIVVNLRKVRWNSFQPNFFILFQKGVLEDAPKTFLASIPQMKSSEKIVLQNALVRNFPNISVLDVNQTVKQILTITDKLSFAVNFMASLAIIAGLVVVFSIARHETNERSWEINLLKVLGAGFNDIRKIVLLEFGLLGFMAAFFSTLLSLFASYGIAWFFFERLWSFRWEYTIFSLAGITFICILTAFVATARVIRQKPAVLL